MRRAPPVRTMADVLSFCSDKNFIKSPSDFENTLKLKLKWSKVQWSEAGEQGTRINKLCNSVNFWKTKLKPAIEDTAIVITLYNVDKDVRIELYQVIEEIEKLDMKPTVKGISQFRNPRYVAIYFESKEQANYVKENFRMIENAFVVYLSWALDLGPTVSTLKVHWLPLTLDINVIKNALEKYVSCIEEERVALKFMSGRNVPSGKVTFKVTINKEVKIESIPHVLNIAEMEALITMPGRLPLCLNCDKLGHISKECKLRFCNVCSLLKEKAHLCTGKETKSSYAAVLKDSVCLIEQEDWGAAIDVEGEKVKSDEQIVLKDKINSLENQILKLQTEPDEHIQVRLDKKRKASVSSKVNEFVEMEETNSEYTDEDEMVDWNQEGSNFQAFEVKTEENVRNSIMELSNSEDFSKAGNTGCIQKSKKVSKNKISIKKSEAKKDNNENFSTQRSYGKPLLNNARRQRENAKFEAIKEQREFIFED